MCTHCCRTSKAMECNLASCDWVTERDSDSAKENSSARPVGPGRS